MRCVAFIGETEATPLLSTAATLAADTAVAAAIALAALAALILELAGAS